MMDEYGPNHTLREVYDYDMERVAHAFDGELMCGMDENGFIYEPASREDCKEYILDVVDAWYCEAQRISNSAKVLERMVIESGGGVTPLH